MKAKTYSVLELNAISKTELIDIVNRQSERFNKQITRAKSRGITDFSSVGGSRRVTRYKKTTKLSKKELIERYQETQRRFGAGISKSGQKANERFVYDTLRNVLGYDADDVKLFNSKYEKYYKTLSKEEQYNIRRLLTTINERVDGNFWRLWYNDTNKLVQQGAIKSFAVTDIKAQNSPADYETIGLQNYLLQYMERNNIN